MASRILLRLIDEAIFPALVVMVTKILGLILLIGWIHPQWQFDLYSFIPRIIFQDPAIGLIVNSYSNLLWYVVVLLGLGWTLAKAYHFHDTHISPQFVLQLLSWNLTGLLTTSVEVYHQGLVWLSYLWLVTLLIGLHTLMGINFLWIFLLTLLTSLLATWLFIADVEREVPI